MELRQLVIQRKNGNDVQYSSPFKMNGKELMDSLALVMSIEYDDYEDFVQQFGDPSTSKHPIPMAINNVA